MPVKIISGDMIRLLFHLASSCAPAITRLGDALDVLDKIGVAFSSSREEGSHSMRWSARYSSIAATLAFAAALTLSACESNHLVVESVDNYSLRNGPSLANSIANGDGFIKGMTVDGSPWKLSTRWTDQNVWDRDFTDPDVNGGQGGDDAHNFDQPGTAISYFTGHGFCDDGCPRNPRPPPIWAQPCSTTSTCNSPDATLGQRMPGTCRFSPLDTPRCCYMVDRRAAVSGTYDINNGVVNYTNGPIRWGESSNSGGWAGAGTNGGTNLVILDISCGILPPFWYQALRTAAAGVHMIGTLLIAGGDTANISDRGATFAKMWAANPDGSVAQAWLDTLSSLPASEGGGINGYGCNIMVAMDATAQAVQQKIGESWSDLRRDDNDAKGNSFYYARWQCNYTPPSSGQSAWELP
jgi:hypothetical protein